MFLNELFSLDGRVAVVIGGSGVLAGEMALGLARAGANTVIIGRNEEKARQKAAEVSVSGRESIAVAADGTSKSDLGRVLDATLSKFGRVDILVNAAGVNSSTPFLEITEDEWQRILDIDLRSVFLACQVFGRQMIDAGRGGSIINLSSCASGPPLSKVFTYGVAKSGVNQITQFLAREWAVHRIRVNAILPGFFPAEQNRRILTPERVASIMSHTAMNRFGEASELIGATIFLASEKASSFVTGAIVRVDGGFGAMTI
jgi:NAD(P)-dependent dehydrogenase (short-subunit alcohol dehydrogenase family)